MSAAGSEVSCLISQEYSAAFLQPGAAAFTDVFPVKQLIGFPAQRSVNMEARVLETLPAQC